MASVESSSLSIHMDGFEGNAKSVKCLFVTIKSTSACVPKFDGECFIVEQKVDKKVDRNKFMPGGIVCWNKFQVAGLNWSIPKQGTIFLIKSKSGVRVGQHIVFNTKVQFKVTNWYKADATCIAQKNIRESCFKLDDIEKYRPTDSPIIIELEEQ